MTPGTILRARNLHFLTLYELVDDSRIPCVLVSLDPWINPQGIMDIVLGNSQWYIVPGVALMPSQVLNQLEAVDAVDDNTVLAIAHSPIVLMQILAALHSNQP